MITCHDLRDAPKPPCCHTCHDGAEGKGLWMAGDKKHWDICCRVDLWLAEQGIDTMEPPCITNPIVAQALARWSAGN